MTMDERRLEELYRDLAADDARRAPSFGSVMAHARRARSARIPVIAAFALAAVVALFLALPRGPTSDGVSGHEPSPPLDFLLQDGRIAGVPAFDLEPRTALSRSVPPGFE
jgi:hypothetical protein